MKHLRTAVIATALAAAIGPVAAQPSPGPTPTPTAKLRANALIAEGVRQSKAGAKVEALALFEDAYRELPDSRILLNIAITQRELGRLAEAAETYQRFIDEPTRAVDFEAQAQAGLAELAPQLGHLQLAVEVTTEAPVEIAVDDAPWRALPRGRRVHVAPGAHRIRARGGGVTRVAEAAVDAAAGATVPVTLRLIDDPPPVVEVAPPVVEVAPPVTEAPPVAIEAAPAPRPPGRFGALVAVAVDPASAGAAGVVAVTAAVHPRVRVNVGGMLGGNNAGFVTATAVLRPGRLQPVVTVGGVVAFYAWDGADHGTVGMVERTLIGAHGAVGAEYWLGARLGVLAEVAAEYYPSGEPDVHPLVVTPTVGVRARL